MCLQMAMHWGFVMPPQQLGCLPCYDGVMATSAKPANSRYADHHPSHSESSQHYGMSLTDAV